MMFNWTVSDTSQYLEQFNFDSCQTELFEIEMFYHLTVGKLINDVYLKY